jgi:hypothetical protein
MAIIPSGCIKPKSLTIDRFDIVVKLNLAGPVAESLQGKNPELKPRVQKNS